jgi:hypothetical protein
MAYQKINAVPHFASYQAALDSERVHDSNKNSLFISGRRSSPPPYIMRTRESSIPCYQHFLTRDYLTSRHWNKASVIIIRIEKVLPTILMHTCITNAVQHRREEMKFSY